MSRFASAALAAALLATTAFTAGVMAQGSSSIPDFSSNGWKTANGTDFIRVPGSPAPVSNDPAHPYISNGIANRTGQTSSTIDEFNQRFSGRLMSLSRAHDILTDENWRGAAMGELIRTQVLLFAGKAAERVHYRGDLMSLRPSAAQHVAIDVGTRMDETIRDLQAKGGKWTNGKEGGAYAYLDFVDSFGLAFELNGTARPAAAPAGAAR